MKVICAKYNSCDNYDCNHIYAHICYDRCGAKCNKTDHYGATCIKYISIERKEKLKKIYESRRNL